jgi:hypothetical protein
MGSRATGRGDAGRARGEATALGRRERAERNDLNRRRRAGGRARARDARDARDPRFVAVSVALCIFIARGFGRGSVLSRERWIGFAVRARRAERRDGGVKRRARDR